MLSISTYFWGHVIQPTVNLYKRDKTLHYLKEINELPFMTEDETYEYQNEMLQKLLYHCYNNVPYYRDLFKKMSLTPTDFKSLEDINKLPILTRDIINRSQQKFIATNIDQKDLCPKATGGSTGTPLNIYYDRNYWFRGDAGILRSFLMAGYNIGEPIIVIWAYPENLLAIPQWQQTIRQYIRRRFYFDTNKYGPEEMRKWADKCMTLKPTIIYGYASAIFHFAKYLQTNKIAIESIKGVFTTSEKLYQFQKDTIQNVFDCKVYDNYGCVEALHVAFECPNGNMHRSCDFTYIETESDEAFDRNYFIITSLWNYGFPIIRYKNNDMGSLIGERCTCGRGYPLLDLEISRLFDNIITPDGKIIHGTLLMHLLYGIEGIERYQFYQPTVDSLILYIEKSAEFSQSTIAWLKETKRLISDFTKETVNLRIEYKETIPATKAGKYLYIRSDIYKQDVERSE